MGYADELMKATHLAAELDWYAHACILEFNRELSAARREHASCTNVLPMQLGGNDYICVRLPIPLPSNAGRRACPEYCRWKACTLRLLFGFSTVRYYLNMCFHLKSTHAFPCPCQEFKMKLVCRAL